MPNARDLCRGHKRLRPLVEYALNEGWQVVRTPGGHLKFTKAGLPPVFTGSTASDHRADRNARAQLRRAGQQAAATDGDRSSGGPEHG